MLGDERLDSGVGRNPQGNGGEIPSPGTAARPHFPRIKRTCPLKTVIRIDPKVGLGIYTESARVQKFLEESGLPVTVANLGAGAYCLVPADRAEVAARIFSVIFPQRPS